MSAEHRLRNAGWTPQRAQQLAQDIADLTPRQQQAVVSMALAKPMKRSSSRPLPGHRDLVQKRINAARAQNRVEVSKAQGGDPYDRDSSGRFAANESRGAQRVADPERPPAVNAQEALRNPFLSRIGKNPFANPFMQQEKPQQAQLNMDMLKSPNLNMDMLRAPKTAKSFEKAMQLDPRFMQLGDALATGNAFKTSASYKDAVSLFESKDEMFKAARNVRSKKLQEAAKQKVNELEAQKPQELESRRENLGHLLGRNYSVDLANAHDWFEPYGEYPSASDAQRPWHEDGELPDPLGGDPQDWDMNEPPEEDHAQYDLNDDEGNYQYWGIPLPVNDSYHLNDACVAADQLDLLVDSFASGNFDNEIELSFTDRDGRLVLSGTEECQRTYTAAQVVKLLPDEVVRDLQNLASHSIEFNAITPFGTLNSEAYEIANHGKLLMNDMYEDPLYWDKKKNGERRDLTYYGKDVDL